MDIVMAVEELGFDGGISLGRCSRSTVYRWTKTINEYLELNKYEWRVKADYKNCCIDIIGWKEN
jgi:hypothetical protein